MVVTAEEGAKQSNDFEGTTVLSDGRGFTKITLVNAYLPGAAGWQVDHFFIFLLFLCLRLILFFAHFSLIFNKVNINKC